MCREGRRAEASKPTLQTGRTEQGPSHWLWKEEGGATSPKLYCSLALRPSCCPGSRVAWDPGPRSWASLSLPSTCWSSARALHKPLASCMWTRQAAPAPSTSPIPGAQSSNTASLAPRPAASTPSNARRSSPSVAVYPARAAHQRARATPRSSSVQASLSTLIDGGLSAGPRTRQGSGAGRGGLG